MAENGKRDIYLQLPMTSRGATIYHMPPPESSINHLSRSKHDFIVSQSEPMIALLGK
jgi:hypothetical protein